MPENPKDARCAPPIGAGRGRQPDGLPKRRRCMLTRGLFLLLLIAAPAGIEARTQSADPVGLCDAAARAASRSTGVPIDVLRSISRTETGRAGKAGLVPWPWTVNIEGTGKWFQSREVARAYVFENFKRGARSFDVGCFQINYRWHGAAFRSIDDMFDPYLNAAYAAEFLLKLYSEFGNWSDAAGAYHSRSPELARAYVARFDRIRAGLDPQAPVIAVSAGADRRRAQFSEPRPLIPGGALAMGSLVPLAGQGAAARQAIVALN